MARRRNATQAFTLVEIMVVVVIISVLATLAVPSFQQIQKKSKMTAALNDFRVFAAAFNTYAQETGGWPADAAVGVFPTGMDERINKTAWERTTPLGGNYNWEYRQRNAAGTTIQAGITINPWVLNTPNVNVLYDLEHTLDSTNTIDWFNGSFQLGTGVVPLYVVQP